MKEGAKVYVGIDIAKEHLDAAAGKIERRFGNNGQGLKQLRGWLGQRGVEVQVICEASGGYERALVQDLQKHGVEVSLVQASRVRQFARASGLWPRPIGSMRAYSVLLGRRSSRGRPGPGVRSRRACGSWMGNGGT